MAAATAARKARIVFACHSLHMHVTPPMSVNARRLVPVWLHGVSDFLRGLDDEDEDDEDENEAATNDVVVAPTLPVCAIDCADGELYYAVLCAWCVPWEKVSKAHFLKAWFALDADKRRELVREKHAFDAELAEGGDGERLRYVRRMLERDDEEMMAALLTARPSIFDEETASAKSAAAMAEGGVRRKRARAAAVAVAAAAIATTTIVRLGATGCLALLAERQGWADGDWTSRISYISDWDPDKGTWSTPPFVDSWWYREETLCAEAAFRGSLPMLRLLRERGGCVCGTHTCSVAAGGGHLACLRYLHEDAGCAWDHHTYLWAAEFGRIECLVYAFEHGCYSESDPTACAMAASNGHIDCLQYMRFQRGCPWDESACSEAARKGRLACLRYLHEQGCPWDSMTCREAASRGHLDCLQYAHENGCARNDAEVCIAASFGGHLEVLQYVRASGCTARCSTVAATYGYLACLRYLREQGGCPWEGAHACADMVRGGHSECLAYAHENGCPWDGATLCQLAARYNSLECLKYAYAHGCAMDKKKVIACAMDAKPEYGTTKCELLAEWVRANCTDTIRCSGGGGKKRARRGSG